MPESAARQRLREARAQAAAEREDRIRVPFTPYQVASLNAYQISGFFHPFTCGGDDCHGIRLIAAHDGWHCASQTCDYHQLWAHTFMADWSWNGGVKWGSRTVAAARETALPEDVRCSIACDDDCEAECHSDHEPGHKKTHWPYDCPAADRYDWGSPFVGNAVKRLRGERDRARAAVEQLHRRVTEWREAEEGGDD